MNMKMDGDDEDDGYAYEEESWDTNYELTDHKMQQDVTIQHSKSDLRRHFHNKPQK